MYRKGDRTTGIRLLRFWLLVILTALSGSAIAAPGFTFLQIGVGAREGAMGGAGAALSTGSSAAYFNPANLTLVKRGGALLMLNRHFADITSQYLALTMRNGPWAITPHYLGTTVPDIELRDRPTREPAALFDSRNVALGLSIARESFAGLSFGATVNYLYEKIYKEASDGWGFDFGASWAAPISGLRLGAAVQNLGKASKFVAEAPDLPTLLRGGATFTTSLGKFGDATIAADWLSVRDQSPEQRFGLELATLNILRLRGGFISGVEALDATAGFGLYYHGLQFDYAYIPFREELGEGHRFAFGVEL
ncbi:PorV/PorQ family protein [bacterium]|nr:PorV/PorQ family protein [bacterium]